MDWVNTIKTLGLLFGPVLVTMVPMLINGFLSLFGCTGDDPLTKDVIEVATCSGGSLISIPLQLQAVIGGVVATVVLLMTGALKSGTWFQNLFNRSVPMVSKETAAKMAETLPTGSAGVVTPDQVADKTA